ncbi:MAG: Rpn family recombination-promoting nuclease/putative transposase [Candidatus Fibromonas sp.]|jgi:predicted transposase/invertase (TIGR01784 family)|nr:Rpn family recombination-promoting nuclease/putative transposase [Candidatus Fibromonas sp.]
MPKKIAISIPKTKPIAAARFAPLFIDFTFKRVFTAEKRKKLLISLIESFLGEYLQAKIIDLFLLPNEQINKTRKQRAAVFDLHCTDNIGNRFIIEVQISKQEHFLGRLLFYIGETITNLVKKGRDYKFDYPRIYSLNFLNYEPEPKSRVGDIVEHIRLAKIKKHSHKYYPNIHLALVIVPRFKKTLERCKTTCDLWLYLFKNLHLFDKIPPEFNNKRFRPVFDVAEICNFNDVELRDYEANMKYLNDYNNTIEYAKKEGMEKGVAKGVAIGRQQISNLFALWESGVPLAEAKRKFGLEN